MNRADLAWRADLTAARVIRQHGIAALPVDPSAIATAVGIEVRPMPAAGKGVSGMLLRIGNNFGIAYATHVDSQGFRNFSIAHELGHYFLEGHVDAVLAHGNSHESYAGFGLDPVWWTSSERRIRWPEWDQARRDDGYDDSSPRSSKQGRTAGPG